jgi:hypothetical protein
MTSMTLKEIYGIKNKIVDDMDFIMPFGKYKGMTIDDILADDAGYLLWLHNNTDFELSAELLFAAENPDLRDEGYVPPLYDGGAF